MDFAFFAVNFGYSRPDYDSLTETEKAFIYKAYEDKVVRESSILRDAVHNAIINALRKKGSSPKELWTRRTTEEEIKTAKQNVKLILEIEKNEKGWVDRIRKAGKHG